MIKLARRCIAKSQLLESCLISRSHGVEFVWDPALLNVSLEDFEIVKSFLETGEYTPQLVPNCKARHAPDPESRGSNGDGSPPQAAVNYYLEGLVTEADHDSELLRCGHVYCLAQSFKIPTMQALVLRKAQLGFPKPNAITMLKLVNYLFSKAPDLDTISPSKTRGHANLLVEKCHNEIDPMRAWLIDWLAENMRAISVVANAELWETLDQHKGLKIGVFVRAAQLQLGNANTRQNK